MNVVGLGVVPNDLDNAYSIKTLNKSAGSYIDFSTQQLEQQTRDDFDEQLSFWEAEFKTVPEMLPRLLSSIPRAERCAICVPEGYLPAASHQPLSFPPFSPASLALSLYQHCRYLHRRCRRKSQ
ncbi:hypothetical protein J3F83DRAFT_748864 [Trichoderma novae-zelandiae]